MRAGEAGSADPGDEAGVDACDEVGASAESCCSALDAVAGDCAVPGDCAVAGDCAVVGIGSLDLAGLDEAGRLQALAALTARFSAAYLRSIGGRGDLLSYPRVRVLEVLHKEGPVIMRDLADALGMTARNITGIVDALELAGLVSRQAHPSDRRATVIELTAQGRATTIEARTRSLRKVAAAFDTLPLDDQQRYADLLGRLAAALCAR